MFGAWRAPDLAVAVGYPMSVRRYNTRRPEQREMRMVTIGMNYQVLPGKEDAFISMFRKVLDVMGGIDGHARSYLYRDVFDPQSFLIQSEWTSRDAFDGFIASDTFKKVANWGKEQILAGRPRHEVYEKPGP